MNLYRVPSSVLVARSSDGKTYYRDGKLWAHRVGNYLHDASTNQVLAHRSGNCWYREHRTDAIYHERAYPHE
jgi:hypothetical protein